MQQTAIIEAFSELPDPRRGAGQRHAQALCLALFTLAIAAGNKNFLPIGDWIEAYRAELIEMFQVEKARLPSYSTIRRVLLNLDYQNYSMCLAKFFGIKPLPGETIALCWQSTQRRLSSRRRQPNSNFHPAIMLVSAYIVERGLILDRYEFDSKTNEIKALPEFIKTMALFGVVFAFDAISTQKTPVR